jgi:excisionase family DNA binding protein
MEPDLLTYDEAAAFLKTKIGTLRQMVHYGRIPYIRFGPRSVRFRREALAGWLAAREHPAHDQAGRSSGRT